MGNSMYCRISLIPLSVMLGYLVLILRVWEKVEKQAKNDEQLT